MSKRMLIPGLSAVCAFAMIGSVASTAMAQQVPVRVVQGSDGTLYLVQGGNSLTLVPDQISDSDVAGLNPTGEADGIIPNDWLIVQAPAAPPVAAAVSPPAQPAAPQPAPAAPAPLPPPAPAPLTGNVDLTGGKAAHDIPGTAIGFGATITSIVDPNTNPQDVFSFNLTAGVNYRWVFSFPTNIDGVYFTSYNPDARTQAQRARLQPGGGLNIVNFTPAVGGTYYVIITITDYSGGRGHYKYTFSQV